MNKKGLSFICTVFSATIVSLVVTVLFLVPALKEGNHSEVGAWILVIVLHTLFVVVLFILDCTIRDIKEELRRRK